MNTAFLLLALYDAAPIIPLDMVARDFFPHLGPTKLAQKIQSGEIALPVYRSDINSQKSAKGVALLDLAEWIDKGIAAGRRECEALTGVKYGTRER